VREKRHELAPLRRISAPEPAAEITRDELQEMIEGAKASIQAHDVDSAMKVLDDLETAARRLSESDRRQLAYEIRDLRTSIKLAML
jgi:ribosomal protein S6